MKNKKYKILIILSLVVLIASFGIFILFQTNDYFPKISGGQKIPKTPTQVSKISPTKIYFVGDIMLNRGVESSVNKNFNGDFYELFKNTSVLKEADILFGNLEGPISSVGNNVGSKYSFRMSPNVLPAIKKVGFNMFSFANNHVGDWNVSAFENTLSLLRENEISFTGAGINKTEARQPTIIKKNNTSFGFLGFSDVGPKWMEAKENKSGILLVDDPDFSSIISQAKEKVDVLIVSIHFGVEYEKVHNKKQEKVARLAIDSGADMIIGHHPHVVQDVEYYKDKPIFYSLGNFIFDQHFSRETMRGLVVMTTFEGKTLKEIKYLTSIQDKKYQIVGLFKNEEIDDVEEVLNSKCQRPDKEYLDMILFNIGQDIGLPDKNYTPKKLVELGDLAVNKDTCLVQEAKKSLMKMIEDASKSNLKIKATSAFRNYSYQENLFKNALTNLKNPLVAVAKPGHSEHQLGTTVDLSGASINFSSAISSFDNTPEELWLRDNAYKYGFVMSYPYGKESITGYKYEPWHYRYIGIDLAKKVKDSGLTLTEYLR